jgi:hypothetical protein
MAWFQVDHKLTKQRDEISKGTTPKRTTTNVDDAL